MPKSQNQKLKILYLHDFLLKNTDENHPATIADIIGYLASNDIEVERKTVYSDLDLLKLYGVDIIMSRGKKVGYFIGSRDFELPELKLLVDSVQSSKFITSKKTLSLIHKLENLTNSYEAGSLHRQVYVHNRVKTMNESVYRIVDEISNAINANNVIQFKYYRYNIDKTREYRHEGLIYEISPFALIWDDENYYLLGYDAEAGKMKHFRVDKMAKINAINKEREGIEIFKNMDMSTYNAKVFGMFGGEQTKVDIKFDNSLIDPVIDRFGTDVFLFDEHDGTFIASIDAQISPQFYAWVFGFGNKAEIMKPAFVREEMRKIASEISEKYKN